MTMIERKEPKL